MKLGVFDSGLGGLLIARSIHEHMPDLDIVYYGDTLRLPYGNRSDAAIYKFTQRAMSFLFEQGCFLIVVACNTASAAALRKLQQEWLPHAYPGRNILGVVVPTLEEAVDRGFKSIGLIATNYIIHSGIYQEELGKLAPDTKIYQQATPLLVPLIENDGDLWLSNVLEHCLKPLINNDIDCLLLGCTHYPFLKPYIREIIGPDIALLSQDDIIPGKLEKYLDHHPEYEISRGGTVRFCVSDLTENYIKAARVIYGEHIEIEEIK